MTRSPTAVPVDVHRAEPSSLDKDLQRAAALAELLDTKFEIAGFKFGIDGLVGLIPGVGDLATTLLGVYPLLLANKHNLGRIVTWRMAANLAIDLVGGAIPIVGDLFDIAYKANSKNFELLKKAAAKKM